MNNLVNFIHIFLLFTPELLVGALLPSINPSIINFPLADQRAHPHICQAKGVSKCLQVAHYFSVSGFNLLLCHVSKRGGTC